LLSPLLGRELSLSTLSLVSNLLKAENCAELIALIRGKTKREAEELLISYRPQSKPRESIKPLGIVPAKKEPLGVGSLFPASTVPACAKPLLAVRTFSGEGETKKESPCAELEKRFELRFSITAELKEKLDEARILLSGKYPCGVELEQGKDEALEVLLEKKSPKRRSERRNKNKEKRGARKPREQTQHSRHIPQKLRDEVYQRDGGCCAYVGSDGKRCASTFDLELHHVDPYSKGGGHSLENLKVCCRRHNALMAELDYGEKLVNST
jgi:5-methylcytosine-specific restriction endonuclease McrA